MHTKMIQNHQLLAISFLISLITCTSVAGVPAKGSIDICTQENSNTGICQGQKCINGYIHYCVIGVGKKSCVLSPAPVLTSPCQTPSHTRPTAPSTTKSPSTATPTKPTGTTTRN